MTSRAPTTPAHPHAMPRTRALCRRGVAQTAVLARSRLTLSATTTRTGRRTQTRRRRVSEPKYLEVRVHFHQAGSKRHVVGVGKKLLARTAHGGVVGPLPPAREGPAAMNGFDDAHSSCCSPFPCDSVLRRSLRAERPAI